MLGKVQSIKSRRLQSTKLSVKHKVCNHAKAFNLLPFSLFFIYIVCTKCGHLCHIEDMVLIQRVQVTYGQEQCLEQLVSCKVASCETRTERSKTKILMDIGAVLILNQVGVGQTDTLQEAQMSRGSNHIILTPYEQQRSIYVDTATIELKKMQLPGGGPYSDSIDKSAEVLIPKGNEQPV